MGVRSRRRADVEVVAGVVGAVVLVTTLASAAAALAATSWVVVGVPGTSTNAVINAASARTNTDVWAVGLGVRRRAERRPLILSHSSSRHPAGQHFL
jgi:1-aminocyclopropane-1-carboxylate deaminase/D-cysteine desulfhydrase-like pyridoxal-dependent ACC family enzyme